MSKTVQISTHSSEETERVAANIAKRLRGGEVIELVSDLGGGKTTFTRGLVAGLDGPDRVASPTFTISREYTGGRLNVYHFDFYRLAEPGIIADELAEVVGDPEGVVVVEWGESVQHVLPADRLRVQISAKGETERQLKMSYPEALMYLREIA